MGASNQRFHLQSEVSPPIGGGTSNWRSHLQLEVSPLIRGVTSNQRSYLQLEVRPPIGDLTSNQRSHLLEVFFVPSGVITILNYIKNKTQANWTCIEPRHRFKSFQEMEVYWKKQSKWTVNKTIERQT